MPQSLVVLDPTLHKDLTFTEKADYSHAINQTTTPLFFSEFSQACLSYPILFTRSGEGDRIVAMALLGSEENATNLFVDPQSHQWKAGHHIPATLTTYPFFLGPRLGNGQQTLLIDRQAPHFHTTDGNRLYTDQGIPTPLLNGIFHRFQGIHKELEQTNQLIMLLVQADLLKTKRLVSKMGTYSRIIRDHCIVLDPQRVARIPPETLQSLHDKGILPHLYAVITSMGHLNHLTARMSQPLTPSTLSAAPSVDHLLTLIPEKKEPWHPPLWAITTSLIMISVISGVSGYFLHPDDPSSEVTSSGSTTLSQAEETASFSHQQTQAEPSLATTTAGEHQNKRIEHPNLSLTSPSVSEPVNEPVDAIVVSHVQGMDSVVIPDATVSDTTNNTPALSDRIILDPPDTSNDQLEDTHFSSKFQQNGEEGRGKAIDTVSSTGLHDTFAMEGENGSGITHSEHPTTVAPSVSPKSKQGVTTHTEQEENRKAEEILPDTHQQPLIHALVVGARQNIKDARLSHPETDNAIDKIEKIRAIDPNHPSIEQLKREVFDRYLVLATWNRTDRAYLYLEKAENLFPKDPRTKRIRKLVDFRLSKRQE